MSDFEVVEKYLEEWEEDVDLREVGGEKAKEFDKILTFSTEKANYYFNPCMHLLTSKNQGVLEEVDAMVLEYPHQKKWGLERFFNNQYKEIMEKKLVDNLKPVYILDHLHKYDGLDDKEFKKKQSKARLFHKASDYLFPYLAIFEAPKHIDKPLVAGVLAAPLFHQLVTLANSAVF